MTNEEIITGLGIPQGRSNTRLMELDGLFKTHSELSPEELSEIDATKTWKVSLACWELRQTSPGPHRQWALEIWSSMAVDFFDLVSREEVYTLTPEVQEFWREGRAIFLSQWVEREGEKDDARTI